MKHRLFLWFPPSDKNKCVARVGHPEDCLARVAGDESPAYPVFGAHSVAFGGLFKFIKTNSILINNFIFVGVGLQGSALGSGLTTSGNEPSLRPGDINQGPNSAAHGCRCEPGYQCSGLHG